MRRGFEADLAVAVGARLGLELAWVDAEWSAFYDVLRDGAVDAIWSSQAVTPEREAIVSFTRPYGRVRRGRDGARRPRTCTSPADLAGRRVAAISGSTNLRTAQAFAGAELVEFAGDTDDVFGDMIAALRAGEVDAFVDDEPPLQELDAEADDLALALRRPLRQPVRDRRPPRVASPCARRSTAPSATSSRAASWRRPGSAGSRASPCPTL